MHKQRNSSMMHKIQVFIWDLYVILTTLLLLKWECTEKNKKEFKGKHPPIYLSNHFILFFSYTNFGLYKSYPLKRNLVLEISKKKDV